MGDKHLSKDFNARLIESGDIRGVFGNYKGERYVAEIILRVTNCIFRRSPEIQRVSYIIIILLYCSVVSCIYADSILT